MLEPYKNDNFSEDSWPPANAKSESATRVGARAETTEESDAPSVRKGGRIEKEIKTREYSLAKKLCWHSRLRRGKVDNKKKQRRTEKGLPVSQKTMAIADDDDITGEVERNK